MDVDVERGPFRSAEPTREARAMRAREASFARVERWAEVAIARERRRERFLDRLVWAALALSIVASGAVLALMAVTDGVGGPLICPALAFFVSSALIVRARRVGKR